MIRPPIFAIAFLLLFTGCATKESPRTDQLLDNLEPHVLSLFRKSQQAFQQGHYQEALALIDSVEANAPELPDMYFFRGTIYMALRQFDNAKRQFERTLEIYPNYPGAWLRMGDISLEFSNQDEAIHQYKSEQRIRPQSEAALKLGRIYTDRGEGDSAQVYFEQAIELDTTNASAHFLYGQLLEKLGKYEDAIFHSHRAFVLEPGNTNYQFVVGSQLFRSGRSTEARTHLEQAANALPYYYPAQYTMGQLLTQLGQHEQAKYYLAQADSARVIFQQINLTEQAINRYPTQASYWVQLGKLYHKAQMFDRATQAFTRALSVEPNHFDAQFELAKLMMAAGNTPGAIQGFQYLLSTDSTHIEVRLSLGLAFAITGNCADAKRAWETVLSYQPGNIAAKGYLAGLCQYQAQ